MGKINVLGLVDEETQKSVCAGKVDSLVKLLSDEEVLTGMVRPETLEYAKQSLTIDAWTHRDMGVPKEEEVTGLGRRL